MLRKSKRAADLSALETDLKNTDPIANIILRNIEDGIILINAEQKVAVFNPGASRIIGLTAEQAMGKDWTEALRFIDRHGITVKDADNPVRQAFRTTRPVRDDDAFVLTAGQRRLPLHLIATPLINAGGQVAATVVVMRDMSEEREREEAKTDFVSTASHEMRTPLAALEGYLTLIMADDSLSQEAASHARKAHQNVMHLGKLFKNLLTTSQSEDGRLSHHPQIFVLNDLLDNVVAENSRQAATKEISLQLAIERSPDAAAPTAFHLDADPQRIQELLNNILDNAIKYTDPGGRIDIGVKPAGGFVQIKIEDSGYGVSPKDLPHLFQKFYRVDNSQPGTGLGLFICKKIVELYGGDLWAESEVGRGSIFYVTLPRHQTSGG
ncbi:PAS domain-containing sensor histidine kinase [Candidatus Saccharibacteria bacterium]|nr:PAS domain-containing sensor histidine kinase [Candidatus Saccharibacteria bacterium]